MRFAALFMLLAGGAVIAAQSRTPAAGQPPTFKVNVDYVEVDVFVSDADGNFVRDLKAADFQILEDGKRQSIATFAFVDIPVAETRAPRPAVPALIEADVRTNEQPFDGRIYVMIIDDLHTNFGRTGRVRAAARQFVERHFGANDLMAVVHTAGAGDANQDFTGNPRLLLGAIDRTSGRNLQSATLTRTAEFNRLQGTRAAGDPVTDSEDAERASNATRSLNTLRDVAQWFARVNGRRKGILFVSEGIDYDITNWADNASASIITNAMRDAIAAAGRGSVAIYGIDPRGLATIADDAIQASSFPDDQSPDLGTASLRQEVLLSQASLRELSGQTGGFAVVNQSDFSNAFDRIVRDNSSYYVLAYYPPKAKAGASHRIDVSVRRPGVTVRARQGYVTSKPAASAAGGVADAAPDPRKLMTAEIREALDNPIPQSQLAMSVFAAPFRGKTSTASVLVGVEVRGSDLKLDARDKLTVTFAAIDTQGKIRGGTTDAVLLNLGADTRARVTQNGLRLLDRLDLPPGRYQLRLAAQDASGGNVGSVTYDLDVPDFGKAPLSLSGLLLTSAFASAKPTVRPDAQLQPVLPASPVAVRAFPQNDQIALYAEVYDNEATAPHTIDLAATVTASDGRVAFKAEEARETSEMQTQGAFRMHGFGARISMKDLAPGSYVLTVSAKSRLGNSPAAERQIPFSVTLPRPVPAR